MRALNHIYLKPKLHKEGVPQRPVISSVNCHTSKISESVDYHLQPIMQLLTRITWLKVIIHKHSKHGRYKGCKKVSWQPSKAISGSKANRNVLTLSNFIFNCRNYLQTKGYAMGTICAPSCTNIFMDHFEKNLYTHLSKGSY